ncbi:MAG TPA: tautomerase family protein [Thermoanaerobaculia bacterium]|nr:tautomerase family protein [Thermoanaerobaculia bacterium]
MPLVKIWARKPRSLEQLRTMGDCVHEALVATANVPPKDRFQILNALDAGQLVADPTYAECERSADQVIIEVTLNAGRTLEVKKALYGDVVRRLGEALDVRPDDVLINLVEVTKENWSFGKGMATYG